MNTNMLPHLLHLTSPALPIGAFAYSQGLEYAVDNRWITDSKSTADWIDGVLRENIGKLEAPILLRTLVAIEEASWDKVNQWATFLLACKETKELREESRQIGLSMQRLWQSLNVYLPEALSSPAINPVTLFAFAANHWKISHHEATTGYLWSWCENQIAAATKIVPLGQTEAQQALINLIPVIEETVALAKQLTDDEIGSTLPSYAIASSLHEQQYSRLFRS